MPAFPLTSGGDIFVLDAAGQAEDELKEENRRKEINCTALLERVTSLTVNIGSLRRSLDQIS